MQFGYLELYIEKNDTINFTIAVDANLFFKNNNLNNFLENNFSFYAI